MEIIQPTISSGYFLADHALNRRAAPTAPLLPTTAFVRSRNVTFIRRSGPKAISLAAESSLFFIDRLFQFASLRTMDSISYPLRQ